MTGGRSDLEIRLHGRGGQGGVTCAKILAAVYARLGKSVQTFGDYAGERSGAPVRAYTRVADRPITNRNKVYEPDHVVVLDATLMGPEVVAGLAPGGTLLIDSPHPPEHFAAHYGAFRVSTVDATGIARRHKIGSRSVIIVNTTIAGAFVRALDLPFEMLERAYDALGFRSNVAAAREAYDGVRAADADATVQRPRPFPGAAPPPIAVESIPDHQSSPAPALRTGSWRSQVPRYVERLAPCVAFCPAGNDVIGFIQALERHGVEQAAAVLGSTTPLASVCGRVCPAPCQDGCNRSEYDGAVRIRGLERWVGDRVPVAHAAEPQRRDACRVAIVGGGPAGLSAAYTVARAGHRATIFEGDARLGGVLRTGIPTYRLPRDVLDREVDAILALGVEARCGAFLDGEGLAGLGREYDTVVLATGLQRLRSMPDGEGRLGVEQGISYLRRVNAGGAETRGHVVVLGGGNTAMDCARSALRGGASRVTVAYRRTRQEMPAISEEIDEAEQEGIEIRYLLQPVGLRGNGRVTAVELAEVELGDPDETGRRRPVPTSRTVWLDCNAVLLALGQSADLSLLPTAARLEDGRVEYGGEAPLYACGDVATGEGTVTHAIGDGRRAAGLALRALGVDVEVFERPDRTRAVPATDIRFDHFRPERPNREVVAAPDTRRGFSEVNAGLPDAMESHRCFSCGHCTTCDTCLVYCPDGVIHRTTTGYEIDYAYCKGCGLCTAECPRAAMELRAECPAS